MSASHPNPLGGSLVLVGGTGGLGKEIAKGLVTANGFDRKKALVRGDLTKGKDLVEMGWEVVLVQDLSDDTEMESVLAGSTVIVSTLSGGDLVNLETTLIRAGKKVGVKLFVPSQFGVDYRRWGNSFPFIAAKKAVLDSAEHEQLPTLKVFNGFFSDSIFDFFADPANAKATMIGDGLAKVSWTKRSDIGYVLAKALEDPEYQTGGFLSMAGDTMSFKDALANLEKALGKELTIETMGAEEALKLEQELLKKGLEGDMGAFYGSFKYHLMGEPERGNDGCNVSADAKTYGLPLASLKAVLEEVYGQKN
jgi:uncharacterized protein YbjT (DUF2867 family)